MTDKKQWENLRATFERERLLVVSTVVAMTITFLALGFLIGIIVLTQTAVRQLEEQAQVTVFFKDDFPEKSILEMQKGLKADPRVLDASYVSKDEAFRIFSEISKNEPILLESISANILPASLHVRAKKLADLSTLASELEAVDGVEEIKFFRDVIERFRFWSTVSYVVGAVLVLAFLTISYSIVITTLRVVISSKGVEYEILKLVGATDAYIKKPLVFQGVFFGILSATIALIPVVTIVTLVAVKLFGFNDVLILGFVPVKINTYMFSTILGVFLLGSGGLLGFFGSVGSVKRYLNC
ncbi:hypothetical protein HYW61_00670 [candidate division WWE3 bacterium]|nr:hypothetical protein [candidate division WWE3 bacterium]